MELIECKVITRKSGEKYVVYWNKKEEIFMANLTVMGELPEQAKVAFKAAYPKKNIEKWEDVPEEHLAEILGGETCKKSF